MATWISRILNRPTTDRTFLWLDEKQGAPARQKIERGSCYVGIRIKSARIPYLRQINIRYHLSVASWLEWRTPTEGMQKGTAVLSPDDLRDLTAGTGDRLAFMDKPILRAVPWAGELQLKIGLFAVVESNLAKPVLDYLVDATETLGFGFAGPAKVYADLVNKASDAIFGAPGSTDLLVGLDRSFLDDDLQSGYLFISDAPAATFDRGSLKFDGDDNRILYKGSHYQGEHAYMVLEILPSRNRNDWADFAELRAAWNEIRTEFVRKDGFDQRKVDAALDNYGRLLRASADLLTDDARQLDQKARETFGAYQALSGGHAVVGAHQRLELPEFEEMGLADTQ